MYSQSAEYCLNLPRDGNNVAISIGYQPNTRMYGPVTYPISSIVGNFVHMGKLASALATRIHHRSLKFGPYTTYIASKTKAHGVIT